MRYFVSIKDDALDNKKYYLSACNKVEYPTKSSIYKKYYKLSKCRQLIIIDKLKFDSHYSIIPRMNENESL